MTVPLIEGQELSLSFGGEAVLDNVSLAISAGEIITLIGPNGAGKSTLVKALLGLQAVERGVITRKPGLRVGYVPQKLAIDRVLPMTVKRFLNLTHHASLSDRVDALKQVGASAVLNSQIGDLSGGETQRVMLARALLRKPDLLVLDEPTQGVDVAGQADLYRLIETIRRDQGCAVLMISHDLHLVMAKTDKVVCFNRHVCCSGLPETVRQHPEYRSLFGYQAADAIGIYHHEHDLSGQVVGGCGHDHGHNHSHGDTNHTTKNMVNQVGQGDKVKEHFHG
ncbi:zinc ABC transporter ATP-binding protein ZnuC [Thalassospira sp. MCCC 1A01428]|uniref:zinc ABC transporter ATP-binding protein ZnuC n=1 Tax=Thalassospira sp. MCCC 1A01428 TaxID=1470575 RepID=UPI000A1FFAB3|nr:zinc ABC transporter ATP-binding protein ZnuC [Thalassospira sp. MCCC 1A01428]OSQ41721.1 zinc ABC transporter ATP-binding protein [Thalassospira sp. MCCC 1A01428]